MELGERIIEFVMKRKISFDGECYHSRIPMQIIKLLQQYGVKPNSVQWEGVWSDGKLFHVILTFGEKPSSKESKNSTEDEDYITLQG